MANTRYFQLALILEQCFKDLSDEERKPYFDVVNRLKELEDYRKGLPVDWCSIYSKKNNYSYKYANASEKEIAACREEAKQNFVNLLEKFPDLGEYCHWTVYSKMVKLAAKRPTKNDKAAEESAKTTESSNTWEIVDDADVLKSEETMSTTDSELNVNDNTSAESEVVATWELVEDEEN